MTITVRHHEYIKKLEARIVELECTLKAAISNVEYAEDQVANLEADVEYLEETLSTICRKDT